MSTAQQPTTDSTAPRARSRAAQPAITPPPSRGPARRDQPPVRWRAASRSLTTPCWAVCSSPASRCAWAISERSTRRPDRPARSTWFNAGRASWPASRLPTPRATASIRSLPLLPTCCQALLAGPLPARVELNLT